MDVDKNEIIERINDDAFIDELTIIKTLIIFKI